MHEKIEKKIRIPEAKPPSIKNYLSDTQVV